MEHLWTILVNGLNNILYYCCFFLQGPVNSSDQHTYLVSPLLHNNYNDNGKKEIFSSVDYEIIDYCKIIMYILYTMFSILFTYLVYIYILVL